MTADLITLADAAKAYGVTRQAVEQAIARAVSPPTAVMTVSGGIRLFSRDEIHQWWVHRAENAWVERRGTQRQGPAKQLNARIPLEMFDEIAALTPKGQTVSRTAANLIAEALERRRGAR